MDAGQIVAQINSAPVGGMAAKTVTSSADGGGQKKTVFAGLMHGLAQNGQGRPTDQSAKSSSADSVEEKPVTEEAAVPNEVNPDMLAALIADAMEKSRAQKELVLTDPVPQQQTADNGQVNVLMSQNVTMSAAGMQVAPAQQSDGRMPESTGKMVPQGNEDSLTEIMSVKVNMASTVKADDIKADNVKAGSVKAEVVAPSGNPEAPVLTAPAITGSLAEGKSADKLLSGRNTAIASEITTAENKAATITEIPAQEPLGNAVEKTDLHAASVKQEGPVAANISVSGREAVKSPEIAASPVIAEKVEEAVRPSEFRFVRTVSVEAEAVNGQSGNAGLSNSLTEAKASISNLNSAETAASGQVEAEGKGGKQSGFGNSEKGFENSGSQFQEAVKSVVSQPVESNQLFKAEVAAVSTPQSAQAEPVHMVSSEHVAGQVKEQLASREIRPGNDQITIKLSPDHLGDIKVSFRLDDQRLKVEIVAENRTARESLMQHVDSLKESLARQNITMDKFDVTGGSSSFSDQGGNSQSEWRELAKNRQAQQWMTSGGYRTAAADNITVQPAYFAKSEQSTLDLHY